VNDLITSPEDIDPSVLSREQARTLFESLVKKADHQTFSMLNPFPALLIEAAGKRA
jgi:hypothetical protein